MLERSPGDPSTVIDTLGFVNGVEKLVGEVRGGGLKLGEIRVGDLLGRMLSLACEHRVKLETSFVTVAVGIIVMEGVGRQLDPYIDLLGLARPLLVQAMKDKDANDDSTASGSEDKEVSDVGISSRRTSSSGCGGKEASDVGTESVPTSASGGGSISLPLSGFSQAELDALSEFELDAVTKSSVSAETREGLTVTIADATQKGRGKFADLEIDSDPVSDACAILQKVSSPIGALIIGSSRNSRIVPASISSSSKMMLSSTGRKFFLW